MKTAPAAPRLPARAFSLLEVVVASVILAVLLLATGSLLVPLQRGTAHTTATVDMGQDVRRVLADLRREVRQTGYRPDPADDSRDIDSAVQITSVVAGKTDRLVLRLRTDFLREKPDGTAFVYDASTGVDEEYDYNWGREVTYEPVASDTVPKPGGAEQRYALLKTTREFDPGTGDWVPAATRVPVANGLSLFRITPPRVTPEGSPADDGDADTTLEGGEELEVTLEACRTNPDWSGGGTPAPLRLKISERLRVYNRHRHATQKAN